MFKDKDKELRRLEAELLLEAELEKEEARLEAELAEEEALLEAELEEAEALLEDDDDFGREDVDTYRNFANQYTAFDAYNSDTTDEDLDEYSEEVYHSGAGRSIGCLGFLAVCLTLAILGVLAWMAARYWGILP